MSTQTQRKFAFIFPGQASQAVGMGKDLYNNSIAAREVFREIDDVLGRKLTETMFSGTAEELTRTENAQPAITAVSLAAWKAMEEETNMLHVIRELFGAGSLFGVTLLETVNNGGWYVPERHAASSAFRVLHHRLDHLGVPHHPKPAQVEEREYKIQTIEAH